ncbi:hypothetical protein Sta7437_2155 [Stanieria cyanosphaera PCC 7437]|uniref:Guanylate kinase n=1 Tax=Stanieria cyanosphaera (strain ATCC 29371 / PCC 7437) TaxID=111780 RepID=K9XUG7_STAC7|nr:hypothetical protein [Stanieria cyanosphaera]AFZ35704.1 hypothetical protein Sta7437_2155 [Stanieria cyanosphaera PCC 7437]
MANSTQLLILAGPSCAGKTTLIKAIKNKTLDSYIYKQLKVQNLFVLPTFEYKDLKKIELEKLKKSVTVIIHYDLYNIYLKKNSYKYLAEIDQQFDEVIVITLYVPSKVLLKRIKLRIIKTFIRIFIKPTKYKSTVEYLEDQWTKYRGYRTVNTAHNIYSDWFEFSKTLNLSSHWLIDSSQEKLKIKSLETINLDRLFN